MRTAIVESEIIMTRIIDLFFPFACEVFDGLDRRFRGVIAQRLITGSTATVRLGLRDRLFLGEPAVCSTAVSGAFRKAAARHTRAELGLAKLGELGAAALQTGRSPAGATFGRSGLSGNQGNQGSNCPCKGAFHAFDPFWVDGGRLPT
jgi:hypothetical protein